MSAGPSLTVRLKNSGKCLPIDKEKFKAISYILNFSLYCC